MDTGTVSTSKFRMQYIHFGNGNKPMVILPGMSIKSIIPSANGIESAFSSLTEDFSIYVFDRKEGISSSYSVPEMAEDTYVAMQALGLGSIYIFGASQGGMMALSIASEHPDSVKKIFVCSTLARQNSTSRKTFAEWYSLAGKGVPLELNKSIFDHVYSKEYLDKFSSAFDALWNDATSEEMLRFKYLSEASLNFDIYDKLDRIKCDVFVAGSENDKVLSSEGSYEIAERLGCPLFIYNGYSHAVYDEADGFTKKIKKFFLSD